jgi:5-methyltetrahydropteroyltriglutamate--homocysteine methyltransferase
VKVITKYDNKLKTNDIGSFPLPHGISKDACHRAAMLFHRAWVNGLKFKEIEKNRFIKTNFIQPVIQIFKLKQKTGLDFPNYPQFRDMNLQFLELISDSLTISSEAAIIPEVEVLREFALRKFENTGKKIVLQVCISGAIELGIAKFGAVNISDGIIEQLALCVDEFVKNNLNTTEYCKIGLISLDEPRLGLVDLPKLSDDGIIQALDIESQGCANVRTMIHLHSFSKAALITEVRNIDILAGEFASDTSNYGFIDPSLFYKSNKKLRAGIAISSLDTLLNRYFEKEGVNPRILHSVKKLSKIHEPTKTLKARLNRVLNEFGDLIVLVGPDCGLGGWMFPRMAAQLLYNIVSIVQQTDHSNKEIFFQR